MKRAQILNLDIEVVDYLNALPTNTMSAFVNKVIREHMAKTETLEAKERRLEELKILKEAQAKIEEIRNGH